MIDGFEEETCELNEYELNELLPLLVKKLPHSVGKENAVKSNKIKDYFGKKGIKINGARLRKLINYIRRKNLVPCLIASNKGYYVSDDIEDFKRFIESLRQRENAIRAVRIAMEQQYITKMNVKIKFPVEKGNWKYERTGYRCQKCQTWVYEDKVKECYCDDNQ
jgi:hypothetical protein